MRYQLRHSPFRARKPVYRYFQTPGSLRKSFAAFKHQTKKTLTNSSFRIFFKSTYLVDAEQTSLAVGLAGLEPATSVLSGLRSNQLSYRPIVSITNTIADYNIPNPAFKPCLGAFRHATRQRPHQAQNAVILLVSKRQLNSANQ